MFKHDIRLIAAIDLPAALGLLTRLPVIVDMDKATARGAAAVWAYPLVGVILGVILSAAIPLLLMIGLPGGIVAALVLALSVILTGAMHEDGLADSADGLWGGWTRERRLEIMKDSRIGVYGVCAIGLSLLIRWLALGAIITVGGYWVALIAVGALSRAGMVVLMAALPHARSSGLSHSVGRPPQGPVWLAVALACGFAVLMGMVWLIPVAVMGTVLCGLIARAKIGGQTGDILGATQQVGEMVMLIAAVMILT